MAGGKNKRKSIKKGNGETIRKTISERTGLTFPVGRITRMVKNRLIAERIGHSGPIYLTACMEFITNLILTESLKEMDMKNEAKKNINLRIKPNYINSVIKSTEFELYNLFKNSYFNDSRYINENNKTLIEERNGGEQTVIKKKKPKAKSSKVKK